MLRHHSESNAFYETFTDGPIEEADLLLARQMQRKRIEWLWHQRIPIGKVTLLVGDPGQGKSLIALDLAARVSTGVTWPDELDESTCARQGDTESGGQGESAASISPCLPVSPSPCLSKPSPKPPTPSPSSVLLLNSDDDLADTILPRLDAHGADSNRIFLPPSVADLRHDFAKVEAALNHVPDCRLVVVDPINAFVGPNDSHFHTVVRRVLAPFAKLAAKKRLAIVAITHLRKHEGAAIHRAAGSMGFVSAARAVWTVCRDPREPNRKLFVPLKSNLAAAASILAYSIEPHPEIDAPFIRWEPAPLTVSLEEALAPPTKTRGPDAEDRHAAETWLRAALADGPLPAFVVLIDGESHGFRSRTLQRALHSIGGIPKKDGPSGGWTWALPPTPPKPPC